MIMEEERQLRHRLSLWMQLGIGTWLSLAILSSFYLVGQANLPVFGYIPWEGGPKMTFESEVACWRHLSIAKKTNEFLLDKDCKAEKEK